MLLNLKHLTRGFNCSIRKNIGHFKVQGDAVHKSGATWCADHDLKKATSVTNSLRLRGVDTMAWWSRNGCGNTIGSAWLGGLCDRWGSSLNEKQHSIAQSAQVSTACLAL